MIIHPPKISVVKKENLIKSQSINYIPKIGDDVYCRVTKVTKYFTNCEIIATNSQKVNSPISASIRKEGVKDDFKEFDMFECFIPGDIIFAKIISTEMTNAIYISTTDLNYGVVFAKSLLSNELMMPVSFDKMLCLDSGLYEKRKVAKPNIN